MIFMSIRFAGKSKKGVEEKKYFELLKNHPKGLTRIDIRDKTGMKTSTENDITKRLLKRSIITEKDSWDEKQENNC